MSISDSNCQLRILAAMWNEADKKLREARDLQAQAEQTKFRADIYVHKLKLKQRSISLAMQEVIFANED